VANSGQAARRYPALDTTFGGDSRRARPSPSGAARSPLAASYPARRRPWRRKSSRGVFRRRHLRHCLSRGAAGKLGGGLGAGGYRLLLAPAFAAGAATLSQRLRGEWYLLGLGVGAMRSSLGGKPLLSASGHYLLSTNVRRAWLGILGAAAILPNLRNLSRAFGGVPFSATWYDLKAAHLRRGAYRRGV